MKSPTADLKKQMSNMKARQFNIMELIPLTTLTNAVVADVNDLLKQLTSSGRQTTPEALAAVLTDPNTHIFVFTHNGKIVGMGCLVLVRLPSGLGGRIEDVVVSEQYRGQGLGEKILSKLIAVAGELGVTGIELTSKPSRAAANKLYKKLGFEPKETNVYRLKL